MTQPKLGVRGYIVISHNGPRELTFPLDGSDPHGILMQGDYVTLFPTRARAQGAILRTRRYARRHKLPWAEQPYQIWRVV